MQLLSLDPLISYFKAWETGASESLENVVALKVVHLLRMRQHSSFSRDDFPTDDQPFQI
jgi:hypothetical protein